MTTPDVVTETGDLLNQFLEMVGAAMYRRGASVAQVAKRAGIPPMMLVRILDGEIDVDLRQMADIGWALGLRWGIQFIPRKVDRAELRKAFEAVLKQALTDDEDAAILYQGMAKAIEILDDFDVREVEM